MSGRRRGSLPRPRRALGPVVGSVVITAAWVAIAHNSGSGWVQALGALLAAFLLVGLLSPAVAVRRARATVVGAPGDARAGQPLALAVELSAPVEVMSVDPPGDAVVRGPRTVCDVLAVPAHRGELRQVRLQLASAAPFGLLWWTRQVTLPLPRPVLVAPRLGPRAAALAVSGLGGGEDRRRVPARVGEPRGVRPYQPGDLRHWVHWPATAHTGGLMVREMEEPAAQPVVVRVTLPADPAVAERLAERALGTVVWLLGEGRTVVLETTEAGGPHRAEVPDAASAGRRLALATAIGGTSR